MKKLIVISLVLFVFGGIIAGIAVGMNNGFIFKSNYETSTTTIDEDFSSIEIDLEIANLSVKSSENEKCTVIIHDKKNISYYVAIKNDTLFIEYPDDASWLNYIFDFGKPAVSLYLPKTQYASIDVESETGDIVIGSAFYFEKTNIETDTGDIVFEANTNGPTEIEADTGDIVIKNTLANQLEISTNTGNINIENSEVAGQTEIETSTGDIKINKLSAKSLGVKGSTANHTLKNITVKNGVSIKNTTGDIDIYSMQADSLTINLSTGDTLIKDSIFESSINATASTGDITFDGSDANTIIVHTSTGNVTGTLLTGKIFDAKSNSGSTKVPDNDINGGSCKINTRTGRIKISIK